MIKNLASDTAHVIITNSSYGSWPTFYSSSPSAGLVRYNGSSQNLEVYDGHSWLPINGTHGTINLSITAKEAIEWASKKMYEEQRLTDLAKNNSAVSEALKNFKEAEQILTVVTTLATEHGN
jgi:hypothetical protein